MTTSAAQTAFQVESQSASQPARQIALIAPSRERRLFLVLPIFIGILAGLAVVCFHISIEWLRLALLGPTPHAGQWRLLIVPATMGLIISALVTWVFPGARGSGLNQTKAALYINDGYISVRTTLGKLICTALSLGAGYSQGPEDPSLQAGAGIASVVSRRFGLSKANLRLFAPAGAAAGLAAAFNAPITALLFVIEEIVGSWNAGVLGSIVLAAISADAVTRWFYGDLPLFRVPTLELRDPREFLAYGVLGILGAFAATIFSRSILLLRPPLARTPFWIRFLQPPIAGLLIGLIGFLGFPQVMGVGYEGINQVLNGGYGWRLLLALAGLKMLATLFGFTSGTPGGMFAPTLFIGAMLGTAVGTLEQVWFPHLTGPIGSYTLAGMGVLFAALLRAPLTSVFMILEISGDYSIAAPVILANTMAWLVARKLDKESVFEMLTRQDGLYLPSLEELREETRPSIEDAISLLHGRSSVPLIQASITLGKAIELASQPENMAQAVIVQFSDNSACALTETELQEVATHVPSGITLNSLLPTERLPLLFPDQPLEGTLPYFSRWPAVLIHNRADTAHIEGILTEADVLACYRKQEP